MSSTSLDHRIYLNRLSLGLSRRRFQNRVCPPSTPKFLTPQGYRESSQGCKGNSPHGGPAQDSEECEGWRELGQAQSYGGLSLQKLSTSYKGTQRDMRQGGWRLGSERLEKQAPPVALGTEELKTG